MHCTAKPTCASRPETSLLALQAVRTWLSPSHHVRPALPGKHQRFEKHSLLRGTVRLPSVETQGQRMVPRPESAPTWLRRLEPRLYVVLDSASAELLSVMGCVVPLKMSTPGTVLQNSPSFTHTNG